MKEIANEDLTITFISSVVPPDALYSGDIPATQSGLTTITSSTLKCKNKFALLTSIVAVWNVASFLCPFTSSTYKFVSGGGSILATSTKCLNDNQYPLRVDDSGSCKGSWALKVSPNTPLACSCTFKIKNAGQDKVFSN